MSSRTIQLAGAALANALGMDFTSLRLITICLLGFAVEIILLGGRATSVGRDRRRAAARAY